jgi:hypothetical protein
MPQASVTVPQSETGMVKTSTTRRPLLQQDPISHATRRG